MAATESSSSTAPTAHDTTMNSNGGGGGMKQLLFPAFSDAGNNNNVFVKESRGPESVISDASTCVLNNLTSNKNKNNKAATSSNKEARTTAGFRRESSSSLSSSSAADVVRNSSSSASSSSPVEQETETRDSTMPCSPPEENQNHQQEDGGGGAAEQGEEEVGEGTINSSPTTGEEESPENLSTVVKKCLPLPSSSSPSSPPDSPDIVIPKLTSRSIESLEKQERAVLEDDEHRQPSDNSNNSNKYKNNNLLLGSRFRSLDVSSDVLSTASEMGTVIETSQEDRLAQVEAFLQFQQEEDQQPPPPMSTPNRLNYYESMFQEDGNNNNDDGDDDDLALPMLTDGNKFYSDEKKSEKSPPNNGTTDIGSVAASAGGGILSRTMKRFTTSKMSSAPTTPHTPRGAGVATATTATKTTPTPTTTFPPFSPPATTTFPPFSSPRRRAQQTRVSAFASTPSSFLLRSPGSAARLAAKRGGVLEPRFSSLHQHQHNTNTNLHEQQNQQQDMSIPEDRPLHLLVPQQQQQPQQQPFRYHQIARACFSFDAYDTCQDHLYEVPVDNNNHSLLLPSISFSSATSSPLSPRRQQQQQQQQQQQLTRLEAPTATSSTRSTFEEDEGEGEKGGGLKYYNAQHVQPLFRGSYSWDGGSVDNSPTTTYPPRAAPFLTDVSGAFRPTHTSPSSSVRRHSHAQHARAQQHSGGRFSHGPSTSSAKAATMTNPQTLLTSPPRRSNQARSLMMMQSPPRVLNTTTTTTRLLEQDAVEELKSPQRIEIEREDALDILACLVERGVAMKDDSLEHNNDVNNNQTREDLSNNPQGQASPTTTPVKLDMAAVVRELKHLSSNAGDSNPDGSNSNSSHAIRVQALDELVRSHEYAMEMRRVSQSASSWLKSIGRSSGGNSIMKQEFLYDRSNSGDPPTEENFSECIDLLTAKAMLHLARIEIEEKSEYADRLNAELAKCRAEIGRLKSSANSGTGLSSSFRSPNRSILDASDDLSNCESEGVDDEIDRSFDNASPILDKDEIHCLDSSFEDIIPLREDKSDVKKFQAALEEANEMIRKLHAERKQQSQGESCTDIIPDEAPVVEVSEGAVNLKSSLSPGNQEESTVNVRMLDAENYITDWDELRQSLPPPPDHVLRSPIVATVLQQWSADRSLQECLLSWMEQVLTGTDPSLIPPLTLSSLNHQVRDGFLMHVLPLLLRRHDIRVDVQTRAQRLTTYDLAVSVDSIVAAAAASTPRTPPHRTALDVRRHLETMSARSEVGAESATHSSATVLMSNSHYHHHLSSSNRASNLFVPDDHHNSHNAAVSSRLSYDEIADGMGPHQHSGIMSALGGAIGGLLSRRKGGHPDLASPHENAYSNNTLETPGGGVSAPTPTTALSSSSLMESNHVSLEDEAAQPYHRVLAAPPGRLSITFVEYRGHAMVSDVAPESPLAGWIFPSDILIAIDELPVSGMRVRDIIQVLKDRKGRQRALRVISSHDMTELTMMNNTSALNDAT